MSSSDTRPVLIIGCGYLGVRAAAAWLAAGRDVVALTRNRADQLAALGIKPITGDVLDRASLSAVPSAATVLYAVGRDRSTPHPMREVYVEGLRNVVATLSARPAVAGKRFIYVSSTSVYGQTDGSTVDETSRTEPLEESGHVVLEAEGVLRAMLPSAVVLRFAGIYGPGRILRRQALLNGEPLIGEADKWLNLIHVDDGVRAVMAAEERAIPGETYIVCDNEPVTRRDFYTLAARRLGAPEARFEPTPPGVPTPRGTNRRLSNRKAKAGLGFTPAFPSYREGLDASV